MDGVETWSCANLRLGNGREHFSSLATLHRGYAGRPCGFLRPSPSRLCTQHHGQLESVRCESICANLGGFQGFAQVRLAFSVFIALGRAPTRGVRNDEVIILRAPRHKCVWVWVQCSAVPCLVAPAAHLCANPSNRLSRLSRWTQVFRRCAWVWRGWVSRVSGPARRAYVSALLVTKHF